MCRRGRRPSVAAYQAVSIPSWTSPWVHPEPSPSPGGRPGIPSFGGSEEFSCPAQDVSPGAPGARVRRQARIRPPVADRTAASTSSAGAGGPCPSVPPAGRGSGSRSRSPWMAQPSGHREVQESLRHGHLRLSRTLVRTSRSSCRGSTGGHVHPHELSRNVPVVSFSFWRM